jgi:cytochrome o ubiquinol oxidase subunit 2
MKKIFKIILVLLTLIAAIAASVFYIQNSQIPVLKPSGFIAEKEKNLIITASELMLIVAIPVFVMTIFFSWYYREENEKAKHTPDWEHNTLVEYFWWGIPFVIITCLAVITWKSSFELSPFKPLESNKKPLVIQAVALQWKWLFIYPEEGIATINYIRFPVDQPVLFEITADAPMNSFWIPALGGQIYAMPAMRSQLNLIANKKGVFRGLSSNISGTGFSKMTFNAEATSISDYKSWVEKAKDSPLLMNWKTYSSLVKPTETNPVVLYKLEKKNLFDDILMQYMMPKAE